MPLAVRSLPPKDLGAVTAPTSRSKRTAFTAHSWTSWWAGASNSWEILMMVFVLHCVSTCSLTRRWTSPCLHARIRALCSAKYRAETFPTDQGTKKAYNLFTLKGTVSCFSYKPGTLLRKFEKPISLWATDPDLKHTWFRGQREAFFNLDMRMRISHIQSRTSSWDEKFWHLISGNTRLRTKFFNLSHPDEIEIYYLVSQTTRPQRKLRSRLFSSEFFENLICCFYLDWYFLQKRLLLSWFFLKWYIFFHW